MGRKGGHVNIKKVFSSISRQMLNDFENVSSQIKHPGEMGRAREAALAGFLREYLPSRYSVSSGEIIDIELETSSQCDLIIYDHNNCPLLLKGNDYRVFPSEPVFAVVEVKSVLTLAELEDAVRKIGAIKKLKRTNGEILGVIFAYKVSWKENGISRLETHLQRLNKGMGEAQYVDMICVLNLGFIEVYQIADDETSKVMTALSDMDVSPLLYFFMRLLDRMEQIKNVSPRFSNYLGPTSIGSARITTPLGKKLG